MTRAEYILEASDNPDRAALCNVSPYSLHDGLLDADGGLIKG